MTAEGFAKLRSNETQDKPANGISYKPVVDELRATFKSGKTKDLAWRRKQLEGIQVAMEENHEEITKALRADLGGPKTRGIYDMGSWNAADMALQNLDKWAADQPASTPLTVSPSMMGKSWIKQEPKGVVLILSPWNFPIELCLHPLIAALAAGNCVVLKPSEVSKHCAVVIEKLVNKYLDTSCIKVVQGAVPETTALLKEHWDHIMYTGNGHVGRIVSKAAAEHLTPVTLELGGKSPVIVDKSAVMQSVIERVAVFKWSINAGQICVAPDYVVVHKEREQEFIDGMKKHLVDTFGKDAKQSEFFGRMINAHHVRRVAGLINDTKGEIVAGSKDAIDPDARYIPPIMIRNAQLGEPLLSEEIFGPVLPVITTDSIEDAVEKVNSICDEPLALYVFSEDKKSVNYVLENTKSGGACVNSTFEHLANNYLPFGGVGGSGYGSYHGKAGFDEFTHRRSILKQDTTLMKGSVIPAKPPDKMSAEKMYDMAIKFMVTGFLSRGQRKLVKPTMLVGLLAVIFGVLRKMSL